MTAILRAAGRARSALLIARFAAVNVASRRRVTGSGDAMVSLTTFDARLPTVWLAIESIAAGSIRPRQLTLWLQSPRAYAARPRTLRRLERRGLRIAVAQDMGPHTKYYPALSDKERGALPLVTADDDILYPRSWLAGLLAHRAGPREILAHRARVMRADGGKLAPYGGWPLARGGETGPLFFTSGGGALLPAGFLRELKQAGTGFQETCPRADDVWLNYQARRLGYQIRLTGRAVNELALIPSSQRETLWRANVSGGNDEQIAATFDRATLTALAAQAGAADATRASSISGTAGGRAPAKAAPGTHLRVVPELRAAHVEMLPLMAPARVLYLSAKYELRNERERGGARHIGFLRLLGHLATTRAPVLEIWEPLWLRNLPRHLLAVAAYRAGGRVRGEPGRVCSYAIENNDLGHLLGGSRRLPAACVRAAGAVIGRYVAWSTDKIAFGSEGSLQTYSRLGRLTGVTLKVFPDLPARRPASTAHDLGAGGRAALVAVLEPRKGINELLAAWPEVERALPGAVLEIAGDGPLRERVATWCALQPASRHYLGALSHDRVPELLDRCSVAVLPSRPEGRWREQIGLPIREALAGGLTVVTSDQTGLASWLRGHGHQVVATERLGRDLAPALAQALGAPLPREQVLASLPAIDGRVRASTWLHQT